MCTSATMRHIITYAVAIDEVIEISSDEEDTYAAPHLAPRRGSRACSVSSRTSGISSFDRSSMSSDLQRSRSRSFGADSPSQSATPSRSPSPLNRTATRRAGARAESVGSSLFSSSDLPTYRPNKRAISPASSIMASLQRDPHIKTEPSSPRTSSVEMPGRARKRLRTDDGMVRITSKQSVSKLKTITYLPERWDVPREDQSIATVVDLTDADDGPFERAGGGMRSMDQLIRGEVSMLYYPFHIFLTLPV